MKDVNTANNLKKLGEMLQVIADNMALDATFFRYVVEGSKIKSLYKKFLESEEIKVLDSDTEIPSGFKRHSYNIFKRDEEIAFVVRSDKKMVEEVYTSDLYGYFYQAMSTEKFVMWCVRSGNLDSLLDAYGSAKSRRTMDNHEYMVDDILNCKH